MHAHEKTFHRHTLHRVVETAVKTSIKEHDPPPEQTSNKSDEINKIMERMNKEMTEKFELNDAKWEKRLQKQAENYKNKVTMQKSTDEKWGKRFQKQQEQNNEQFKKINKVLDGFAKFLSNTCMQNLEGENNNMKRKTPATPTTNEEENKGKD